MERKYVMQLPRGAKVSSTDVYYEAGRIVLEAQLEEWKPEDGEICLVQIRTDMSAIFIYNGEGKRRTSAYVALFNSFEYGCWLSLEKGDHVCSDGNVDILRPATDYEKQLLFKCLAENNLRWNADARTLESIRWRAEKGDTYYYLIFSGDDYKVASAVDKDISDDWGRHMSGNYFKTEEAARITGNQILELLKNSKAE